LTHYRIKLTHYRIKTASLRRKGRLGLAMGVVAVSLAACASSGGSGSSGSSDSKIIIGYSQAFSSNAWQKANNQSVADAVAVLKKEGKISGYKFVDANNSAKTQISQIQDLILQHVSVLMIDPTSASALNGVIAKAIHAGIPVLVFSDGPVTSTLPHELVFNLASTGEALTKYVGQRLDGKGNVLNIRGVAGAGGDQAFQNGVTAALKAYPGLKIVNTIYGNWDNATTESKLESVLPGLPHIDAVIQQGGEGYGAAQAFQAVGRPVPLIVEGNQGAELQWWYKQDKANGYQTESIGTNPGIGAAAVYVAYDIATGKKVPKTMTYPNLTITESALASYQNVPVDGQATFVYDQSWTEQNILSQ
jgi:ribose transport system substrate-binding protein